MKKRSIRATYLVVLLLFLLAAQASAGTISTITMPGLTNPVAVNGDGTQGWVLAQATAGGGWVIANPGTGAQFAIGPPTGVTSFTPVGISGNGEFVTGYVVSGAAQRAFLYDRSTQEYTFPPSCPVACQPQSAGISVNSQGVFVGISGGPILVNGQTMSRISAPGGSAWAISENEVVVGQSAGLAKYWDQTGEHVIASLLMLTTVSPDGIWAGGVDFNDYAFLVNLGTGQTYSSGVEGYFGSVMNGGVGLLNADGVPDIFAAGWASAATLSSFGVNVPGTLVGGYSLSSDLKIVSSNSVDITTAPRSTFGLDGPPSSVPEPGSLTLVIGGLLGTLVVATCRRHH